MLAPGPNTGSAFEQYVKLVTLLANATVDIVAGHGLVLQRLDDLDQTLLLDVPLLEKAHFVEQRNHLSALTV